MSLKKTLPTLFLAICLLFSGCARSVEGEKKLSRQEISRFNSIFFDDGSGEKAGLNFRNLFVSSLYETPEDIDLFRLFYNGAPLSGAEVSDAERALLDPSGDYSWCACTKSAVSDMDAVLLENTGLTLSQTGGLGLDSFQYLQEYDAYYMFHGDTEYPRPAVYDGWYDGQGGLYLRYKVMTWYESHRLLYLKETEDGNYLFVSNIEVAPEDAGEGETLRLNVSGSPAPQTVIDAAWEKIDEQAAALGLAVAAADIISLESTGDFSLSGYEEPVKLWKLSYRLLPADTAAYAPQEGFTQDCGWLVKSENDPIIVASGDTVLTFTDADALAQAGEDGDARTRFVTSLLKGD